MEQCFSTGHTVCSMTVVVQLSWSYMFEVECRLTAGFVFKIIVGAGQFLMGDVVLGVPSAAGPLMWC